MTRWAWHPKHGVRRGPIVRASDTLTVAELEHEIHDEAERQFNWIEHHPNGEPLFQATRVCDNCAFEDHQDDMRWTGKRWLCPTHYRLLTTSKQQ